MKTIIVWYLWLISTLSIFIRFNRIGMDITSPLCCMKFLNIDYIRTFDNGFADGETLYYWSSEVRLIAFYLQPISKSNNHSLRFRTSSMAIKRSIGTNHSMTWNHNTKRVLFIPFRTALGFWVIHSLCLFAITDGSWQEWSLKIPLGFFWKSSCLLSLLMANRILFVDLQVLIERFCRQLAKHLDC